MSKHVAVFNVTQPKPKKDPNDRSEKQYWSTIGVAFQYGGETPSIRIVLDALPMPDRDLILFPREDDESKDSKDSKGSKGNERNGGRR